MKVIILLAGLTTLAGCASDAPRRVLLQEQYAQAPVEQTPVTHTDSLRLELAGKVVPVRFTWSAALVPQADSCWKITQLRVERTGGDPSLRITNVRSSAVDCGLGSLLHEDMNAEPRSESRIVFLTYETQAGIKSHTVQNLPVRLNGKGEFQPSR